MDFRSCAMQLPHLLRRAAFWDVLFLSALGVEKCKCATVALKENMEPDSKVGGLCHAGVGAFMQAWL